MTIQETLDKARSMHQQLLAQRLISKASLADALLQQSSIQDELSRTEAKIMMSDHHIHELEHLVAHEAQPDTSPEGDS